MSSFCSENTFVVIDLSVRFLLRTVRTFISCLQVDKHSTRLSSEPVKSQKVQNRRLIDAPLLSLHIMIGIITWLTSSVPPLLTVDFVNLINQYVYELCDVLVFPWTVYAFTTPYSFRFLFFFFFLFKLICNTAIDINQYWRKWTLINPDRRPLHSRFSRAKYHDTN